MQRNYEKKNTWSIRRLVNDTIVPSTQRIILKIVGFLNKVNWAASGFPAPQVPASLKTMLLENCFEPIVEKRRMVWETKQQLLFVIVIKWLRHPVKAIIDSAC